MRPPGPFSPSVGGPQGCNRNRQTEDLKDQAGCLVGHCLPLLRRRGAIPLPQRLMIMLKSEHECQA